MSAQSSTIYDKTSLVAAYLPRQEASEPSASHRQEQEVSKRSSDGRVPAMPLGYVLHPSEPRGDVHGGWAAGRVYQAERHGKKVYVEALLRSLNPTSTLCRWEGDAEATVAG